MNTLYSDQRAIINKQINHIKQLEARNTALKEALTDIARGPLQEPDFTEYVVSKAKAALGD